MEGSAMPTPKEIEDKFWRSLSLDHMLMLGLVSEEGHTRPMTAQMDGAHAPLWFFTSTDNPLTRGLGAHNRAVGTYASKGHDVFASVRGTLQHETDRSVLDRLWNRSVAAWYEGGKEDPKLALLRFDPDDAQVWLNDSSLLTEVRVLFGADPKKLYGENGATVPVS
jgi:general stress protein 26